jgi:hypothetical protein
MLDGNFKRQIRSNTSEHYSIRNSNEAHNVASHNVGLPRNLASQRLFTSRVALEAISEILTFDMGYL